MTGCISLHVCYHSFLHTMHPLRIHRHTYELERARHVDSIATVAYIFLACSGCLGLAALICMQWGLWSWPEQVLLFATPCFSAYRCLYFSRSIDATDMTMIPPRSWRGTGTTRADMTFVLADAVYMLGLLVMTAVHFWIHMTSFQSSRLLLLWTAVVLPFCIMMRVYIHDWSVQRLPPGCDSDSDTLKPIQQGRRAEYVRAALFRQRVLTFQSQPVDAELKDCLAKQLEAREIKACYAWAELECFSTQGWETCNSLDAIERLYDWHIKVVRAVARHGGYKGNEDVEILRYVLKAWPFVGLHAGYIRLRHPYFQDPERRDDVYVTIT